jgi:hypothetical protein
MQRLGYIYIFSFLKKKKKASKMLVLLSIVLAVVDVLCAMSVDILDAHLTLSRLFGVSQSSRCTTSDQLSIDRQGAAAGTLLFF